MPNYFARVELHDAEWPDDYEELHEALKKIGFSPCLHFANGGSKRLPRGFYFAKALGKDKKSVAQKVFKIANDTGYANEVTVIKSGGSESNLSSDCD